MDMIEPKFDMEIIYENKYKQDFHLWIGNEGQRSTLMKTDDTHTAYTVSKEITNKLSILIQNHP